MKSKVVIAEKEAEAAEEPAPRGIPEFWFTIFRNVDMLSELVQVSTLHPGLTTACELLPGVPQGFTVGERHSWDPHSREVVASQEGWLFLVGTPVTPTAAGVGSLQPEPESWVSSPPGKGLLPHPESLSAGSRRPSFFFFFLF